MKLVKSPDPWLEKVVKEFDFDALDAKSIAQEMINLMTAEGGIGLSANQVGLDVRCFIMKTADAGNTAFFNPELTRVSQETSLMKEGCLSFPDIYLMIKRSTQVEMKYYDSDGVEHNLILEGLGARCAQHEIDHLNGIVFLQRASRMKLERALKSRPKERERRIEYEKRQAIAKYIQQISASKEAESNISERIESTDTLPQDSQAQA